MRTTRLPDGTYATSWILVDVASSGAAGLKVRQDTAYACTHDWVAKEDTRQLVAGETDVFLTLESCPDCGASRARMTGDQAAMDRLHGYQGEGA